MKREKALKNFRHLYEDGFVKKDIENLIHDIYDSFEKKNTIDVNIKITDLEPFKDLINLLKESIGSLPTELKDKLSVILDK